MKLLPLAALALAGCVHDQAAVEVRTVEVPVIRVTSCVAPSDIPARPAPLPARPANVVSALDLAVAKLLEWTGYGEKADAVMQGCSK